MLHDDTLNDPDSPDPEIKTKAAKTAQLREIERMKLFFIIEWGEVET